MDWKAFFSESHRVRFKYGDVEFVCHLREPSNSEYLEYRRLVSRVIVNNGSVQSSTAALGAFVYLFDTICERVEAENEGDIPEWKNLIPVEVKFAVIEAWQNRFQIAKGTASARLPAEEKGAIDAATSD